MPFVNVTGLRGKEVWRMALMTNLRTGRGREGYNLRWMLVGNLGPAT